MVPFIALLVLPAAQGLISQQAIRTADKDLFAAALGKTEPSVAALNKLAFPITGKAVIGVPNAPEEVGITPAGAALAPVGANTLWLKMYVNTDKGLVGMFDDSKRSIPNPGFPAVENVALVDGVRWRQTAFVAEDAPGRDRLIIRVKCENISKEHRLLGPIVGVSELEPSAGPDQDPKPIAFTPRITMYSMPVPGNRFVMSFPRITGIQAGGLPATWMSHKMPLSQMPITPGNSSEWVITVGLYDETGPPPAMDVERAWRDSVKTWGDKLKGAVQYSVPEPGFNALRLKLLVQLLLAVDNDMMRYGMFPSGYEGQVFGVEEGWGILALGEWGLGEDAMSAMDATILSADNLDKTNRHHQYRNGLAGQYAWDLYELTGDHVWMEIAVDKMKACALWTQHQIGENGILPTYNYGGDIGQQAQALWPNACCWRGARDAGLALSHLEKAGGPAKNTGGPQISEMAKQYRAKLVELFDAAPGRNGGFMPLSLTETAGSLPSPEYYQLFAPLIMETGIYGPHSQQVKDMIHFMETTGRVQAGIPRFGTTIPGIDAEYAMGLQLMRLRQEDRNGFLLGLFGQLALSCDPSVSTMPEVTDIVATAEMAAKQRSEQEVHWGKTSEPVSAGPGVTLRYMRRMLVNEETDDQDIPDGTLQLCPAIPNRWLDQTQSFYIKQLPTAYGKVTLTVTPSKSKAVYTFAWDGKGVYPLKSVRLRLPATVKSVAIQGATELKPRKPGWVAFGAAKSVTVTVTR